MSIVGIGDLAASYRMRRQVGHIKTDVARLTVELSSGIADDLVDRLKGDYGPLAGIEAGLSRMESFRSVIAERKLIILTQQGTLEKLRHQGTISDALLTLPESLDRSAILNVGQDALMRFSSSLGALNVQSGGRTVFSGVETKTAALADLETIMTALESEIALAGAATAADVETVVAAWFDTGGGYDTLGYVGGTAADFDTHLSDNELAPPLVNAEEDAIRQQLAALSMAALLGRDVLTGDVPEQRALARISGERLLVARDMLVRLQATLGSAEEQIERATAEVQGQFDALEIARANLIEVDPYETAVRLQNTEVQLQTIFMITSRLSHLSLSEYL